MKRLHVALAFALMLMLGSLNAQCQIMSVSVPALHVANHERIIGFEIHVSSGRIARLPNVPIGWNIFLDNDPSWNSVIRGSIDVGAAAMAPQFLRDFMVVEMAKKLPTAAPFDLQGEIIVTSDFVKERRIKISMQDFATKAAERPTAATVRGK